jgi:hypothetical protein
VDEVGLGRVLGFEFRDKARAQRLEGGLILARKEDVLGRGEAAGLGTVAGGGGANGRHG